MVIIGGLTGVPGGDTMLLLDIDISYLNVLEMLQRLGMVKLFTSRSASCLWRLLCGSWNVNILVSPF